MRTGDSAQRAVLSKHPSLSYPCQKSLQVAVHSAIFEASSSTAVKSDGNPPPQAHSVRGGSVKAQDTAPEGTAPPSQELSSPQTFRPAQNRVLCSSQVLPLGVGARPNASFFGLSPLCYMTANKFSNFFCVVRQIDWQIFQF